jgi:hypothetical protein
VEGRSFGGRNEKMHTKEHRGRELDIHRKIDRDNAGKDSLSAGAYSNLQRLSIRVKSKDR